MGTDDEHAKCMPIHRAAHCIAGGRCLLIGSAQRSTRRVERQHRNGQRPHLLSKLHQPKDFFGLVRFGSVRFGSVRFGSVRFGSVRFGSVRFGSVRFGSSWLCPSTSVGFGLVRFRAATSVVLLIGTVSGPIRRIGMNSLKKLGSLQESENPREKKGKETRFPRAVGSPNISARNPSVQNVVDY